MNKLLFVLLMLSMSGHVSAQAATQRLYTKVGRDFKIGPFTTIVRKVAEGGKEANCPKLQQAISAALQDMQNHMASRAFSLGYGAHWNVFEVNRETLDLFCNKRAIVLLRNKRGDWLLINKQPFVRTSLHTSNPKTDESGTMIYIGAALVRKGAKAPTRPDEYGQVFMPDRLLK